MGNLPIGQGIAVTPMQMATAYAAIANGGDPAPAAHRRAVGDRAARKPRATASSPRPPPRRCGACSRACSARAAPPPAPAIAGYVLAGKTGTAEKPDPVTAATRRRKFVSSFVGFAPAKQPKLLVAVMVDEPQGDIYGGLVAGAGVPGHHELRAELPQDPARP